MNKYTYIDNLIKSTVFECEAKDISEADEKYKIAIGKDVTKQPHVGCIVIVASK